MPIFGRNTRKIHLISYNFMEKHTLWAVSFQCLARSLTLPVLPKVNCNNLFFIEVDIFQYVHIMLLSVTRLLFSPACLMILKQDTRNWREQLRSFWSASMVSSKHFSWINFCLHADVFLFPLLHVEKEHVVQQETSAHRQLEFMTLKQ